MRFKALFNTLVRSRRRAPSNDRYAGVKSTNARLAFYGWLFSAAVLLGARGTEAIFTFEALALVTIGAAVSVHVFGYATFMLQRGSAVLLQDICWALTRRRSSFMARFINGFGFGLFAANLAMVWWGANMAVNILLGPIAEA